MTDAARPGVLLDCDPGIDDAVAIALAVEHADVVALTAVGGNVDLDRTVTNALAVLDLLERPDIAVHAGRDLPLDGAIEHRATEFHGPLGTGSSTLPEPTRRVDPTDAVEVIVESARAVAGLWLIATGPLTNVALALEAAPEIAQELAGISWMGGSTTQGNTTAAAEFNAWVDPEAARIVFESAPNELIMVGLNVTHQVLLDRSWITALRNATAGTTREVFADLLDDYEARQRALSTLTGAAVHDALAVMAVTHPHLVGGRRGHVEVVVEPGPNRGQTVVTTQPGRGGAASNCLVAEWADADAVRDVISETLTGS